MPKTLAELLNALPFAADTLHLSGSADTPITAPVVETDADVQPGGVFVARTGMNADGHAFIGRAVERGAAAVIGEKPLELPIPYVRVANTMEATGYLAAAYHDFPSRKLVVIGVTGTDGKTTTSTLIHSILKIASDGRAGLISTIHADVGGQALDTGLHVTTPSAPLTQALLARMVANGLRYAVLEMTSHGLAQGRLNGVDLDVAVLTNLTHEHLDFHKTFENYRAAKGRMFDMLVGTARKPHLKKIAILNNDDAHIEFFASFPADLTRRYGFGSGSELRATDVAYRPGYTQFVVHGLLPQSTLVQSPLVGDFNVMNALAAITTAQALDVPFETIQRGLFQVTAIPGRLERIDAGQDFLALVDFAHTPNALTNVLKTARTLTGRDGRVICVFGCAGLRDREKRRLMPEAAVQLADFSIFTAEDPRTESLNNILNVMSHAAVQAGGVEGKTFVCVPDRGEALYRACKIAHPGDVVIACGKGHEQSMAFGTTEYAWDEREAMRAALRGEPLRTLPTAS
ncbi:MAG: UDP-N-acetylmuramoyl-L-alanyl-D-glutamate--2,6-diaminopimelate ligase [bacterium]|nr:UDP-N-acetylmuramoyl-L-alanyl-D-glutamate--2,6-diaminopimelate ligase [bacterium]